MLNQEQQKKLEDRVAHFEKETGVELIVAIAPNSDPYPAAALRFSLALSLALSAIVFHYIEISASLGLLLFGAIFVALIPLGRLSILKQLALSSMETEREVREKATEIFYQQTATTAPHIPVVLIYTSVQERRVEIMAHQLLNQKFNQDDWKKLVSLAVPHFAQQHLADGIMAIADQLQSDCSTRLPELKDQHQLQSYQNHVLILPPY